MFFTMIQCGSLGFNVLHFNTLCFTWRQCTFPRSIVLHWLTIWFSLMTYAIYCTTQHCTAPGRGLHGRGISCREPAGRCGEGRTRNTCSEHWVPLHCIIHHCPCITQYCPYTTLHCPFIAQHCPCNVSISLSGPVHVVWHEEQHAELLQGDQLHVPLLPGPGLQESSVNTKQIFLGQCISRGGGAIFWLAGQKKKGNFLDTTLWDPHPAIS